MSRKTVAVVIPTIPPRRELLRRTLSSVFHQTRLPDQVIVEPDPDKTGAAATRNRANARVVTDYIAVLDDDDELLPNHIEALMKAAEADPEADVLYPIPEYEDGMQRVCLYVNGIRTEPWGLEWSDDHRNSMFSVGSFIPHTVLMKTETLRDVGGYDEDPSPKTPFDDYNLFIKMIRNGGKFVHVPETTWIWRENPLGHTGGFSDRW